MINSVIAFKNKKSGNFGKPIFEVIPHDSLVEAYTVSIKEAPEDQKERLKELELYYLGEFDTKTGVMKPAEEIEYLIDCGVVLS